MNQGKYWKVKDPFIPQYNYGTLNNAIQSKSIAVQRSCLELLVYAAEPFSSAKPTEQQKAVRERLYHWIQDLLSLAEAISEKTLRKWIHESHEEDEINRTVFDGEMNGA